MGNTLGGAVQYVRDGIGNHNEPEVTMNDIFESSTTTTTMARPLETILSPEAQKRNDAAFIGYFHKFICAAAAVTPDKELDIQLLYTQMIPLPYINCDSSDEIDEYISADDGDDNNDGGSDERTTGTSYDIYSSTEQQQHDDDTYGAEMDDEPEQPCTLWMMSEDHPIAKMITAAYKRTKNESWRPYNKLSFASTRPKVHIYDDWAVEAAVQRCVEMFAELGVQIRGRSEAPHLSMEVEHINGTKHLMDPNHTTPTNTTQYTDNNSNIPPTTNYLPNHGDTYSLTEYRVPTTDDNGVGNVIARQPVGHVTSPPPDTFTDITLSSTTKKSHTNKKKD